MKSSRRASLPTALHAIVSITLCGSYLLVAEPKLARALTTGTILAATPFQSTDLYLEVSTGMRHGSQRLIDMFDRMPDDKSVSIIVAEGRAYDAFIAATLTYLSWPKETEQVPVRDENAENGLRSIDAQKCAAIVFCGLKPPPWVTSGIQLGSNLVIVPLKTEKKHEP